MNCGDGGFGNIQDNFADEEPNQPEISDELDAKSPKLTEEKQEDVTILRKNTFHNEVEELIWCSALNNSTVLALTDKGEVYSSMTQGDSWISMISKFTTTSIHQAIGQEYTITEITQSSANLDVIVFTGESGINWVTKDCGQTLKIMKYEEYKIKDFKFHPEDPNYLMATTRHDCKEKAHKGETNCLSHNIL